MGDRGNHQHHQISVLNGFAYIGGQERDGHQTGLDALGKNAAVIADRAQALLAPGMQPNLEAPSGQVRCRRQTAVTGPHDRNAPDVHISPPGLFTLYRIDLFARPVTQYCPVKWKS